MPASETVKDQIEAACDKFGVKFTTSFTEIEEKFKKLEQEIQFWSKGLKSDDDYKDFKTEDVNLLIAEKVSELNSIYELILIDKLTKLLFLKQDASFSDIERGVKDCPNEPEIQKGFALLKSLQKPAEVVEFESDAVQNSGDLTASPLHEDKNEFHENETAANLAFDQLNNMLDQLQSTAVSTDQGKGIDNKLLNAHRNFEDERANLDKACTTEVLRSRRLTEELIDKVNLLTEKVKKLNNTWSNESKAPSSSDGPKTAVQKFKDFVSSVKSINLPSFSKKTSDSSTIEKALENISNPPGVNARTVEPQGADTYIIKHKNDKNKYLKNYDITVSKDKVSALIIGDSEVDQRYKAKAMFELYLSKGNKAKDLSPSGPTDKCPFFMQELEELKKQAMKNEKSSVSEEEGITLSNRG